MTDKPLCIDLFCGYGGWARGFLDAGYRVIGFDNEPKCAKRYPGEFVLADVRNLDGRRFRGARVIVASPPCEKFSLMAWGAPGRGPDGRWARGQPIKFRSRDPEAGMVLVREAIRIIREAEPDSWVIENVQGAVRSISKELGPPFLRKHAFFLWGRAPGFILPEARRLGKGMGPHPPRGQRKGRWRAIIPYPLARALAEACLP